MLTVLHRRNHVLDVQRAVGEYGNRVDVPCEHKLFERVVRRRAIVDLHEYLPPVLAEVADGLDDAIRMLVPLEGGSEASSDDADADLPRRGVHRYCTLWKRHGSRKSQAAML